VGIFNSCNESIVAPDTQIVQIYFKYSFKNVLNTFENTYQKDLVLDGTITVNFWLTTEEQNQILNKAAAINFFSMPGLFEADSTVHTSLDPGPQELKIKYNNEDNTVVWEYPINDNDQQIMNLIELNDLIISIVEAKPEYNKLPQGRGGYW
jgi:hypothetical protein